MDAKVSVVLPIYNVERYLDRCIRSVVNQTYTNLEIILVDDGSPDNCPAICDSWAKKDSRIRVIHKSNSGLGMARNSGIEAATGKYICFLDSDDYVSADIIKKGLESAEINNADIVLWGFKEVDKKGNVTKEFIPCSEKNCFSGDEIQTIFLPALYKQSTNDKIISNLRISAWTCMFSTETIHRLKWRFVSEREIISEDTYSFLFFYRNISKVAIIKEALYYYCENETSLTRTYRKDRYDKIKYFYGECVAAAEKLNYNEKVKDALVYPYLANIIAALKMIVTSENDYKSKIKEINRIANDEVFREVIKDTNMMEMPLKWRILFESMRRKLGRFVFMIVRVKA